MSGKTSTASKAKYNAKAYDRIEVVVKKGQKDVIRSHADRHGESVNSFINRVIADALEREKDT